MVIIESIKVPKFHDKNYCRMASDLTDDETVPAKMREKCKLVRSRLGRD